MLLHTKLTVTPAFLVYAAALLILLPLPWITGWVLAVAAHELSHCVALFLCKVPVYHVFLDIYGVKVVTPELNGRQTVICSLAGPMGGLLLLLAATVVPRAALIGLLQSVYNLIPLYPLDGGRALYAYLCFRYTEITANRVCDILYKVCLLVAFAVCVVSAFYWKLGALPVILWVVLWLRVRNIKIPCK